MIKETRIPFVKRKLESLKYNGRRTIYYSEQDEGLCLVVNKHKKSYYAQWSTSIITKTGKIRSIGKRKFLGGFNIPLEEIKSKLRQNIDKWKKAGPSKDDSPNVGHVAHAFKTNGTKGYRVKTKGPKIKYKDKTIKSYSTFLDTYVLLHTKSEAIKAMLTEPFKFNGDGYVKGALKDIPLNKISKRDIEIFHARMESIPTTANRALAALSIAFEWDMKRSVDRLYPGDQNPCLKISKFQETKDKKHLALNEVLEVRNYCIEEQWRDAHFLTFYLLCLEVGERLADLYGIVWEEPKSQSAIKECSGWLELDKQNLHLTDSKDRKTADVPLTIEAVTALRNLHKYRVEREDCNFALQSPYVFPRKTDPSKHISSYSYRVKLKYFNFKFGLATRELIRSKGKKRKLYKYKNEYTFKHLRKTFVTHYARGKNADGTQRGLVQASLRMRHSSPKVTKDHYFTEEQELLKVDHMYSELTAPVIPIKKKEQK